MGEAFFEKFSCGHEVKSAGISPKNFEGKKLGELERSGKFVVQAMKELGIDVSEKLSAKLNEDMVNWADKIVVVEPEETWPEFMKESEKVVYWEIGDSYLGADYDFFIERRNQIKEKVEELVGDITIT